LSASSRWAIKSWEDSNQIIVNPESNQKEGKITDQKDQPGCADASPGIFPGQRIDEIQQDFNEDTKIQANYGKEYAIIHAQNLQALVF
jgi:hypothetical protein